MSVLLSRAGAVGIYDSGVGGLTVCRALRRRFPNLGIIYLGDSARAPYGDRSLNEIRQYNFEILHFLNQFPLRMILSGCNTSSAMVLEDAQDFSKISLLGLIEPTAKAVVARGFKNVAVLATKGTVTIGAYGKLLRQYGGADMQVREIACPRFVPLVENPLSSKAEYAAAVAEILPKLDGIDSLIFGCTHFPYFEAHFRVALPKSVTMIDPAQIIVDEAAQLLTQQGGHDLVQNDTLSSEAAFVDPEDCFFTTGDPDKFAWLAEHLVPGLVKNVRRTSLTTIDLFGLSPKAHLISSPTA